jgi:hypothetical protein
MELISLHLSKTESNGLTMGSLLPMEHQTISCHKREITSPWVVGIEKGANYKVTPLQPKRQ